MIHRFFNMPKNLLPPSSLIEDGISMVNIGKSMARVGTWIARGGTIVAGLASGYLLGAAAICEHHRDYFQP